MSHFSIKQNQNQNQMACEIIAGSDRQFLSTSLLLQ